MSASVDWSEGLDGNELASERETKEKDNLLPWLSCHVASTTEITRGHSRNPNVQKKVFRDTYVYYQNMIKCSCKTSNRRADGKVV